MELGAYLADCRGRVLEEIQGLTPADDRHTGGLYGLVLDYPLRPAKALRPALAIASCRMLGGQLDAVLPSAASLELMHNAFLVHDDVEDGSELRRGKATLHREHGVPVAVNVGDGMLALAMRPLLDNCRHVGLGKAWAVLEVFVDTARVSAEGQALELRWMREHAWDLRDADYVRMVYKKTARYSFVAPCQVGCLVAGGADGERRALERFGALLGVAFQVQDDALNLTAAEAQYGKEIAGDLWEGKRTLMLLHALRSATPDDRERALAGLRKPRLPSTGADADGAACRDEADVAHLAALIRAHGSIPYAMDVARRHAERARRVLAGLGRPRTEHRDFLEALVDYVVDRDR